VVALGLPVDRQIGAGAAAEPKDQATDIQRLLDDLDSGEFEVRERAANKLLALEEKALPALRAATRARPSLEKLRRLESIIARTEQVLLDREITRLVGQINEIGIDQFIAYMVERKGFAQDKTWAAALALAQAMVKRAEQVGGKKLPGVGDEFLKFPLAGGPPEIGLNGKKCFLVSGMEGINCIHDCFIISNGPVKDLNSTRKSILFVNGDIDGWNGTDDCVIFCDGNIKGLNGTDNCIIFCTGRVENLNSLSGCVVFADGAFTQGNSTSKNVMHVKAVQTNYSGDNQYLGLKEIKANLSQRDAFLPAERAPLYPLRLFDLVNLGIEVAAENNGVVVTKTVAGKLLPRVGVRAVDQITAIDGKLISSVGEARRLLRRKIAADTTVLQLTRGLETLDLKVTFE